MKRVQVWPVLGLLLLGGSAMSDDLQATISSCNDCHGNNGVSQWPDVPTIAGIDAFVHSEALYIYRDKGRACLQSKFRQGDTSRPETSMCDVAAGLSDDLIEDLAGHYSALPFVAAKQDFDATLAAAGKVIHDRDCSRCHSDGGSNADDEASILAGQWMAYLRSAFAEYSSGDREQLDKMKEKVDILGAKDVEALLHYYASQQ